MESANRSSRIIEEKERISSSLPQLRNDPVLFESQRCLTSLTQLGITEFSLSRVHPGEEERIGRCGEGSSGGIIGKSGWPMQRVVNLLINR